MRTQKKPPWKIVFHFYGQKNIMYHDTCLISVSKEIHITPHSLCKWIYICVCMRMNSDYEVNTCIVNRFNL